MRKIPNEDEIAQSVRRGGAAAVDELFYPGEAARMRRRKDNYPSKQRKRPPPSYLDSYAVIEYEKEDGDGSNGVMWTYHKYVRGQYVGSVSKIRRGFMDIYYRAHDGEEFAHDGGPQGAGTYLTERYWEFGDPEQRNARPSGPIKRAISAVRRWFLK